MIKKQFTLYMENKPGGLSAIMKNLAANKINVEGISVSESTDVALIQLVPSNPQKARQLLEREGVPLTIQEISVITLKHEPGSLSRIVSQLANAGVAVNYIYATGCNCGGACGCECYVVIGADDLKSVEKFWKSNGHGGTKKNVRKPAAKKAVKKTARK
jgi:hypothetical protein